MTSVQGELENVRLFVDVIKSSLGPNALDKLLVNAIDGKIMPSDRLYELFFTPSHAGIPTDGNENNPSSTTSAKRAKDSENTQPQLQSLSTVTTMVAALLKGQQYMMDQYKDGSTSVVLLAASFLELGFKLHYEGISRNKISEVYQQGLVSAISLLYSMPTKKIAVNWNSLPQAQSIIQMLISTKLALRETVILSTLLADSICSYIEMSPKSDNGFRELSRVVDAIHLCPCVGGDVASSSKIAGLVIPYLPVSVQRPANTKLRVAVFATPMQGRRTNVHLLANLTSPYILKQWQKEEEELLKDTAMRLIEAGASIVFSSGSVHKYILHWLDVQGIVVIQSVPKRDLIAISEATGAKLIYQTSIFDHLDFGTADSFEVLTFSGEDYTVVKVPHTVSLLINGPTRHKTNKLLKCCRDTLAVVRSMILSLSSDGSALLGEVEVVCGGGAPEMRALTQLPAIGCNEGDPLAQYILATFASGFEIIPKCLLENSGAPNEAFHILHELHEQGRVNTGITKAGSIEEFNLDRSLVFDFIEVKKQIWSVAADIASLSLLANDSIVGNPLQ